MGSWNQKGTDWDATMQLREALAVKTFAFTHPSTSHPLTISDLAFRESTGTLLLPILSADTPPKTLAMITTQHFPKYVKAVEVKPETEKHLRKEGLYPQIRVKTSSEPGSHDITTIIDAVSASLQQKLLVEEQLPQKFWNMVTRQVMLQIK